jgi:hypothetical protein
VLQLLLSFGHVDAQHLFAARVLHAASAVGLATDRKTATSPQQKQFPAGFPDHNCPTCTTMHMVASGLLPVPPSFAGPSEIGQDFLQASIEEFSLGVSRHLLFQTRAPPIG